MAEPKDKTKTKITDLLKSNTEGLTITEIMQKTGLARHTILARLHNLIGEDKVGYRQINMAKLHRWKHENEESKTEDESKRTQVTPIKEENVKFKSRTDFQKTEEKPKIDIAAIKAEVEEELKSGKIKKPLAQIKTEREILKHTVGEDKEVKKRKGKKYIMTGIPGFDELLEEGIPEGANLLVAGGTGSGKTIFCLQALVNKAREGRKCLYMSFEESEEKLKDHMDDFGWNPEELIKKDFSLR